MRTDFPKSNGDFIKASLFQDNKVPVVFKGYDYVANEDRVKDGKVVQSWKEGLKYVLGYSYPEFQFDKTTGEPVIDEKTGKQKRNGNYDPKFPKGYSIKYFFDIGDFTSGSLRLWSEFKSKQPKPGEHLLIWKEGEGFDTEWHVERAGKMDKEDLPTINIDEPSEETPF